MLGLAIMDLATRQADWLASRQKAVSENIANSDTPGYRATDVRPFADILGGASLTLATTSSAHLTFDPAATNAIRKAPAESWDTMHSGNSVSIDQQFLKANEVRSAYSLNVAIVRVFNRMLLASVKTP